MSRFLLVLIAALLQLGAASNSQASLIKLTLVGTIDRVEAGPRGVGETVSGFLIYDTETLLSNFPTGGYPLNAGFNGAIRNFELANQRIENTGANFFTQVAYLGSLDFFDQAVFFGLGGYDEPTGLWETLDLNFIGESLFDNLFLPTENLDLARASSATFGYTRQEVGRFIQERFYGNVDTLIVSRVPIPAPLLLVLSSIGILLISRRKTALQ